MKNVMTILLLVLFLASAAIADIGPPQTFMVDYAPEDAVVLEVGQVCLIQVYATMLAPYIDYVYGFEDAGYIGNLFLLQTLPDAGPGAVVTPCSQPPGDYCFELTVMNPVNVGYHFEFLFEALSPGQTILTLYDSTWSEVLGLLYIEVFEPVTPPEPGPMTTAFTYQGRLVDSNNVADGEYDMQFKLFDLNSTDPNFCTQQGSTIDINELDVIDGYFTVELDFGIEVFIDEERWLEIGIRPGELSDPCEYTILSPRQELTPTPFSLYAKSAGSIAGGITGGGTANYISKFTGSRSIGNSTIYQSGSNVGIGTTSPEARLDVANPSSGPAVRVGRMTNNPSIAARSDAAGGWLVMDSTGEGNVGLNFYNDSDVVLVMGGGNVGIGTYPPAAKLHVYEPISGNYAYLGSSSYGVYGLHGTSGNYGYIGSSGYGAYAKHNSSGNYGYIGSSGCGAYAEHNSSGNYGYLGSSSYGVRGYSSSDTGVYGSSSSGNGVKGESTSSEGVYGRSTSSYGVRGYSSSGTGVYGSGSDNGVHGYSLSGHGVDGFSNMGYGVYGSYGIGNNYGCLGSSNYGVYGTSTDGWGVRGNNSNGNFGYLGGSLVGAYGKHESSGNSGYLGGSSNGVYGSSTSGYAGYFSGNVYVTNNVSALSYTDRTPYPKDLATAYQAVMSMERLPDGQYQENNKENQLDHSKLSNFVRSENGNRNLSATVSALNEVVKDLIKKVEAQQQLIESQNTQIQQMGKMLQTNNNIKSLSQGGR